MMRSLYTGVSGLSNHQNYNGVLSNNIANGVITGGIFVEQIQDYSSAISNAFQVPRIVLDANGKLADVKEYAIIFIDGSGKMCELGVKATCTAAPNGINPATWKLEFIENGKVVGAQSYSANGRLPIITLSDRTLVTFYGANTDLTIAANPTNINVTKLVSLNTNMPLTFQPAGGTASPLSIVTSHLVLTQYAGGFNMGDPQQDGYSAGDLKEKVIDASGTIVGKYFNGKQLKLGQIATAIFNNQQGLERAGSTLFTESNNSGGSIIGTAGTGPEVEQCNLVWYRWQM